MLTSRLPEIAAQLAPRVDAALGEGVELVAQYARYRVPVDEGDLRDAIEPGRERMLSHYVAAGNKEVFYGHIVENGSTKQPPRPFLVPALEDARDEIEHIVTAAVRSL
jgi:HK97 gp10 family phage protein